MRKARIVVEVEMRDDSTLQDVLEDFSVLLSHDASVEAWDGQPTIKHLGVVESQRTLLDLCEAAEDMARLYHDGHDSYDAIKMYDSAATPIPFTDCKRRTCARLREA